MATFCAEELIADVADGVGDGQNKIGLANAESKVVNRFDTIGNSIAGFVELDPGKEELLAVLAIGHMMLVEDVIIIFFII